MLLVLMSFVAVVLLVIFVAGLADQRTARAKVIRERLAAIERAAERQPREELAILRDELVSEIPSLNRFLGQWSKISRVQSLLSQAGMTARPGKFVLACACSGAVLGTMVMMTTRSPLFGAIAGLIGVFIPIQYVLLRRTRRFHRFEESFPEAIDLLGRATRAGHAFTTGLDLIATEMGEPVAGEFRKLYEEQKFGLPIRDAMLNLAERVPIVDVKFFVTAVMLQRETGGNLAEILDKLAYVIRERFKIQRQVRVFTAQGRLTLAILMALPPGMVATSFVLNPKFIAPLFTDPLGHALIVASIVTQTIGFILIRRIIQVKV